MALDNALGAVLSKADQNLGAVNLQSAATMILALLVESSNIFASTWLLTGSSHNLGQVTRAYQALSQWV